VRKRVLVFLCLALTALAVVPVLNLLFFQVETEKGEVWWSRSVLYNIDFALPFLNRFLYPLGISTEPAQVVIGENGWLYLGDKYRETITRKRRGPSDEDHDRARKIGRAARSWETWLREKGVRLYRVILAPDKATVYPEFLPQWARPAATTATDSLLDEAGGRVYIDTRSALREAKCEFPESLYYKTDTHWTSFGAWAAFRAFAMRIADDQPGLRTLSEKQVNFVNAGERPGGDLANFLRMREAFRDGEVIVRIKTDAPVETEQYDFETGRLKSSGGNPGVMSPKSPLLVKSKNALNRKKILWLRDSFGYAMAPFMAATFSETLQLQNTDGDSDSLARLVDVYHPDYVFVTVVERDVYNRRFEREPPVTSD